MSRWKILQWLGDVAWELRARRLADWLWEQSGYHKMENYRHARERGET